MALSGHASLRMTNAPSPLLGRTAKEALPAGASRLPVPSADYTQGRHRKFINGYLTGVARCSECWAAAVWVEFDIVPYRHELYSRV